MRFKESAMAVALTATLAGCASDSEQSPEPQPNQVQSEYVFLPDAADSDYFQAVNCDAGSEQRMMGVSLTNPLDPYEVSLTLGVADVETARLHDPTISFLGGVTIYAVGDSVYQYAPSDSETTEVDLMRKNHGEIIEIDEDTSAIVSISIDQKGYYFASIACQDTLTTPNPTEQV